MVRRRYHKIEWGPPVAPPNMGSASGWDGASIEDARDWLIEHRNDPGTGPRCPCCGGIVKAYVRRLTDAMARAAIRLYRAHQDDPLRDEFGLREFTRAGEKASTDASYLELWGLISRDGRNRYAITELGCRWVEGKRAFPDAAAVCNMTVERWSTRHVTAAQALDNPFDYEELMGGVGAAPNSDDDPAPQGVRT